MSLHVDSHGSGAPLLFIHGWGMHGGMWGGVAEQLAEHFRVLAVDLPGHGFSVPYVGWVERSDTHAGCSMGIATLNPSYGLQNVDEIQVNSGG